MLRFDAKKLYHSHSPMADALCEETTANVRLQMMLVFSASYDSMEFATDELCDWLGEKFKNETNRHMV